MESGITNPLGRDLSIVLGTELPSPLPQRAWQGQEQTC